MKEIPNWCLPSQWCPLSDHNDSGLMGMDTNSVWDMLSLRSGGREECHKT